MQYSFVFKVIVFSISNLLLVFILPPRVYGQAKLTFLLDVWQYWSVAQACCSSISCMKKRCIIAWSSITLLLMLCVVGTT